MLEDARAESVPILLTTLLSVRELGAHGARHVMYRAEVCVMQHAVQDDRTHRVSTYMYGVVELVHKQVLGKPGSRTSKLKHESRFTWFRVGT